MKANTQPSRPKTPPKRQKSNYSRLFERFALPIESQMSAELIFLTDPKFSYPIKITDLSAFGLGVVFDHAVPLKIASLRRLVEVRLESGAVLEGVTAEREAPESKSTRSSKNQSKTTAQWRLGIALKADGLRMEEVAALPQVHRMSLDEMLRPALSAEVVGAFHIGLIMAGDTSVSAHNPFFWPSLGELKTVTRQCAVVSLQSIQPSLMIGLNCDLTVQMPRGRFQVNCEISDIVKTDRGTDLVMSFTESVNNSVDNFLGAYTSFFVDAKTRSYAAQLKNQLAAAGLPVKL